MKKRWDKIIKIKQTNENYKLIELVKTIKGIKTRKNPFTNTIKFFIPKQKPNPKLSGTGVIVSSKYWTSGIIHK